MRRTASESGVEGPKGRRLPEVVRFADAFAPLLLPDSVRSDLLAVDGLFLTVILRTQGRRSAVLREALLCLAGQDDEDFEVVVVAHDAEPEHLRVLHGDLTTARSVLGERIRLVEAQGGTRGRPIIVGLQAASGRYAVVLDDDDHVTADWVSTFRRLWLRAPGRVLRACSAVRENREVTGPDGGEARVATSGPLPLYCEAWSFEAHLVANGTPFHAFAFPLAAVRRLGITPDENLDVAEDWDLLLRMSAVLGVQEDLHITSIYNKGRADSSERMIDRQRWAAVESDVISRYVDVPRLSDRSASGPIPRLGRRARASMSDLNRSARYVLAMEGPSGLARRVPDRARRWLGAYTRRARAEASERRR